MTRPWLSSLMTEQMFGSGARISSKSFHVGYHQLYIFQSVDVSLLDDFFIGIGDINSTFLPKLEPLTAGSPTQTAARMFHSITSAYH